MPLEHALWLDLGSCQLAGAIDSAAAVWPLAAAAGGVSDATLRFNVVIVGAAWAAVAVQVCAEAAGASAPRDLASSRQRVLITLSRDAILRWSEAIVACFTVGGAVGSWAGRLPPLCPSERERLRPCL